jgi:hypothetical protein
MPFGLIDSEKPGKKSKFRIIAIVGASLIGLVSICCVAGAIIENNSPDSTPDNRGTVKTIVAAKNEATLSPQPQTAIEIPTPTNTSLPTDKDRCIQASAAQIDAINAGVHGIDQNNQVRSGWAVKSNDFENVYMVAAKIYGQGMEEGAGPGVWAIGGTLDKPNLVYAVGGFAHQFSDFGAGETTKSNITQTSDGYQAAQWCASHN